MNTNMFILDEIILFKATFSQHYFRFNEFKSLYLHYSQSMESELILMRVFDFVICRRNYRITLSNLTRRNSTEDTIKSELKHDLPWRGDKCLFCTEQGVFPQAVIKLNSHRSHTHTICHN